MIQTSSSESLADLGSDEYRNPSDGRFSDAFSFQVSMHHLSLTQQRTNESNDKVRSTLPLPVLPIEVPYLSSKHRKISRLTLNPTSFRDAFSSY